MLYSQGRKGIMSRLFFDYVGPLYEEITQRFKHDEIKVSVSVSVSVSALNIILWLAGRGSSSVQRHHHAWT